MTRVVTFPGVYAPRSDTDLLRCVLLDPRHSLRSRSVLDLCTGTGALAVAAARMGADVVAVDVSRRAVLNARVNARLNRVRLRAVCGDLWQPVSGCRFDLIISNPPYLPGSATPRGSARAWDAGGDGRCLLDPICRHAARHLHPDGRLLLMQSSLADIERTRRALEAAGLRTRVVARHEGRLGPLAAARRHLHGQDRETLVVLEGLRPETTQPIGA